jgi:hypothetical protein
VRARRPRRFGRIGPRVAKRCAAFEMRVIVADPALPRCASVSRSGRWLLPRPDGSERQVSKLVDRGARPRPTTLCIEMVGERTAMS